MELQNYQQHTNIGNDPDLKIRACMSLITDIQYFGNEDKFIPSNVADFFKLDHINNKLEENLGKLIEDFLKFLGDDNRVIKADEPGMSNTERLNKLINFDELKRNCFDDVKHFATLSFQHSSLGNEKSIEDMEREMLNNIIVRMICQEALGHRMITNRVKPMFTDERPTESNLIFCRNINDQVYLIYINDNKQHFETILIDLKSNETGRPINGHKRIITPYFTFQLRLIKFLIKKYHIFLGNELKKGVSFSRNVVTSILDKNTFNFDESIIENDVESIHTLLYFFGHNGTEDNNIELNLDDGVLQSDMFEYLFSSSGDNADELVELTKLIGHNVSIEGATHDKANQIINVLLPTIEYYENHRDTDEIFERLKKSVAEEGIENKRDRDAYDAATRHNVNYYINTKRRWDEDRRQGRQLYGRDLGDISKTIESEYGKIKYKAKIYNFIIDKLKAEFRTLTESQPVRFYFNMCKELIEDHFIRRNTENIENIKRALKEFLEDMITIIGENHFKVDKLIKELSTNGSIVATINKLNLLAETINKVTHDNKKIFEAFQRFGMSKQRDNECENVQQIQSRTNDFFIKREILKSESSTDVLDVTLYYGYTNQIIKENLMNMIGYVQSHFDDGVTIIGRTILGSLIGDETRVFGEDCYRKRLLDNKPDKDDNFVTVEYKSLFTKILLITGILIDQAQIFHFISDKVPVNITESMTNLVLGNAVTYFENFKYVLDSCKQKYVGHMSGFTMESLFTYLKHKFRVIKNSSGIALHSEFADHLTEINVLFSELHNTFYSVNIITPEQMTSSEILESNVTENVKNKWEEYLNLQDALNQSTDKKTDIVDETTQGDKNIIPKINKLSGIIRGYINSSEKDKNKLFVNTKTKDIADLKEDNIYRMLASYVGELTGELYHFAINLKQSTKQTALFFLYGDMLLESPTIMLKTIHANSTGGLFMENKSYNDNIKFHQFILLKMLINVTKLWTTTFKKYPLFNLHKYSFVILYNVVLKRYFPEFYGKIINTKEKQFETLYPDRISEFGDFNKHQQIEFNKYFENFITDVNNVPIYNKIVFDNVEYLKTIMLENKDNFIFSVEVRFRDLFSALCYKKIRDTLKGGNASDEGSIVYSDGFINQNKPYFAALFGTTTEFKNLSKSSAGKKRSVKTTDFEDAMKSMIKGRKAQRANKLDALTNMRIRNILEKITHNVVITNNVLLENDNLSITTDLLRLDEDFGFLSGLTETNYLTDESEKDEKKRRLLRISINELNNLIEEKIKRCLEQSKSDYVLRNDVEKIIRDHVNKYPYAHEDDGEKFHIFRSVPNKDYFSRDGAKLDIIRDDLRLFDTLNCITRDNEISQDTFTDIVTSKVFEKYNKYGELKSFFTNHEVFETREEIELFGILRMMTGVLGSDQPIMLTTNISSGTSLTSGNLYFGDEPDNESQQSISAFVQILFESKNLFDLLISKQIDISYENDVLERKINTRSMYSDKKILKFDMSGEDAKNALNNEAFYFYVDLFRIEKEDILNKCRKTDVLDTTFDEIHKLSDSYILTRKYDTRNDYLMNYIKYVNSEDDKYIDNISSGRILLPYVRYGYVVNHKLNTKPYDYDVLQNVENVTENTMYDILMNETFIQKLKLFLGNSLDGSNKKIFTTEIKNFRVFLLITSQIVEFSGDRDLEYLFDEFIIQSFQRNKITSNIEELEFMYAELRSLKDYINNTSNCKKMIDYDVINNCFSVIISELFATRLTKKLKIYYNALTKQKGEIGSSSVIIGTMADTSSVKGQVSKTNKKKGKGKKGKGNKKSEQSQPVAKESTIHNGDEESGDGVEITFGTDELPIQEDFTEKVMLPSTRNFTSVDEIEDELEKIRKKIGILKGKHIDANKLLVFFAYPSDYLKDDFSSDFLLNDDFGIIMTDVTTRFVDFITNDIISDEETGKPTDTRGHMLSAKDFVTYEKGVNSRQKLEKNSIVFKKLCSNYLENMDKFNIHKVYISKFVDERIRYKALFLDTDDRSQRIKDDAYFFLFVKHKDNDTENYIHFDKLLIKHDPEADNFRRKAYPIIEQSSKVATGYDDYGAVEEKIADYEDTDGLIDSEVDTFSIENNSDIVLTDKDTDAHIDNLTATEQQYLKDTKRIDEIDFENSVTKYDIVIGRELSLSIDSFISMGDVRYENYIKKNNFVKLENIGNSKNSDLKIPFFVNDQYLLQEFSWVGKKIIETDQRTSRGVSTRGINTGETIKFTGSSKIVKTREIVLSSKQNKVVMKIGRENFYVPIKRALYNEDNSVNELVKFALQISPMGQTGAWVNSENKLKIITIDKYAIDIVINDENKIFIHDHKEDTVYELVNSETNINISKWKGRNTKNILLVKSTTSEEYSILIFGYLNMSKNSTNGLTIRTDRYTDSSEGYVARIKISQTSNFCIINKKVDMWLLLNSYLIGGEMQNMLELYKLYYSFSKGVINTKIKDFSEEYYEVQYMNLFYKNINTYAETLGPIYKIHTGVLLKYSARDLINVARSVMCRNYNYNFSQYKINTKTYYHIYSLVKEVIDETMLAISNGSGIDLLKKLFDIYYSNNFEHNDKLLLPTISDFMLYIMYYDNPKIDGYEIKDYVVTIYFCQILVNCAKSKNEKIRSHYTNFKIQWDESVKDGSSENLFSFKTNPFEFIYQFATGFIATDDQNNLANEIFMNTFKYNTTHFIDASQVGLINMSSRSDKLLREEDDNIDKIIADLCSYNEATVINEYGGQPFGSKLTHPIIEDREEDYLEPRTSVLDRSFDFDAIYESRLGPIPPTSRRGPNDQGRQGQSTSGRDSSDQRRQEQSITVKGKGSSNQKQSTGRKGGFRQHGGNYNILDILEGLQGPSRKQCIPKVYNMIMGGGKTSMITPLIILKFLQCMISGNIENVYIVMPQHLVQQSYELLLRNLPTYFPLSIQKLVESGGENMSFEYTESLKSKNTLVNVYIMSDLSMKCGLLNDFDLIRQNSDKHMYLFDEVDSVLNPIVSGLNYPINFMNLTNKEQEVNNQHGIKELNGCFDIIFDILYEIYNGEQIVEQFVEQNESIINNLCDPSFEETDMYKKMVYICTVMDPPVFSDEEHVFREKKDSFNKLKDMYERTKIVELYKKYSDHYLSEPHFNVISQDSELITKIKEHAVNRLLEYYKHNRVIRDNIERCRNDKDCDTLTNIDEDNRKLLYILYNFINISLPTCIYFINRKDYGVYHHTMIEELYGDNIHISMNHCIIPFSYSEKPSIGSQFSNPILVTCLTIVNYLVRIKKDEIFELYDQKVINKIEDMLNKDGKLPKKKFGGHVTSVQRMGAIIKRIIGKIPSDKRKTNGFVKRFEELIRKDVDFDFSEVENNTGYDYVSHLHSSKKIRSYKDINSFMTNQSVIGSAGYLNLFDDRVFQRLFCKDICLSQIGAHNYNNNVNGVDLFMSSNFKYKAGFTGTPKIPRFCDIKSEDDVIIDPINKKDEEKINNVLSNKDGKQYIDLAVLPMRGTIKQYITDILETNQDCNVLIDVGAILIGVNPKDVYDIVKRRHETKMRSGTSKKRTASDFYFVFWNNEDRKVFYNSEGVAVNFIESGQTDSTNSFYYYDNQHTTGTDAQIPGESKAIVLLGKFSRYRDVAQGIFRLRELGNLDSRNEPIHKLLFIINEEVAKHVSKMLDISTELLNRDYMIENNLFNKWFEHDEDRIQQLQTSVMKTQNLKALLSSLWEPEKEMDTDNVVVSNKLNNTTNPFKSFNEFYFPTEKILSDNGRMLTCLENYDDFERESIEKYLQSIEDGQTLVDRITDTFIGSKSGIGVISTSQNIQSGEEIAMGETQELQENQEQSQSQLQNIAEFIPSGVEGRPVISEEKMRVLDSYNDYISPGEYYNEEEEIGGGFKISVAKNLLILKESPLFIIRNEFNLFVVSFIEGIKLIDYVKQHKHEEIFSKLIIYDNRGVIYFGHENESDELSILIQPIVNYVAKKYRLKYVKYEDIDFRISVRLLITTKKLFVDIITNLYEKQLEILSSSGSALSLIDSSFYETLMKLERGELRLDRDNREDIDKLRKYLVEVFDFVEHEAEQDKCLNKFEEKIKQLEELRESDKIIHYLITIFDYVSGNKENCQYKLSSYELER